MYQDAITVPPLSLLLRWQPLPQGGVALTDMALRWSSDPEAEAVARHSQASRAPFPFRDEFRHRLECHLRGEDPDWKRLPPGLDLDMRGLTDFSRTVLDTLWHQVAFGQTVTYGELARMAGRPGAARAVGRVMASNRWPLLIPCHRVLGSGGALTGFSGGGVEMKQWLLEREGAQSKKTRRT